MFNRVMCILNNITHKINSFNIPLNDDDIIIIIIIIVNMQGIYGRIPMHWIKEAFTHHAPLVLHLALYVLSGLRSVQFIDLPERALGWLPPTTLLV